MSRIRDMLIMGQQQSEQQPIYYIQSNGSSALYKYLPGVDRNNLKLSARVLVSGNATQTLWCNRGNAIASNTITTFSVSADGLRCDYGNNTTTYIPQWGKDVWVDVVLDKNLLYIDGVLVYTYSEYTFDNAYTLWSMFASHTSSIAFANYSLAGALKFQYFKLENSDTEEIYADWKPVVEGSTEYSTTPAPYNTMYDSVDDTYLTMSGSRGFTVLELEE